MQMFPFYERITRIRKDTKRSENKRTFAEVLEQHRLAAHMQAPLNHGGVKDESDKQS